jgi:hypothetical protein
MPELRELFWFWFYVTYFIKYVQGLSGLLSSLQLLGIWTDAIGKEISTAKKAGKVGPRGTNGYVFRLSHNDRLLTRGSETTPYRPWPAPLVLPDLRKTSDWAGQGLNLIGACLHPRIITLDLDRVVLRVRVLHYWIGVVSSLTHCHLASTTLAYLTTGIYSKPLGKLHHQSPCVSMWLSYRPGTGISIFFFGLPFI